MALRGAHKRTSIGLWNDSCNIMAMHLKWQCIMLVKELAAKCALAWSKVTDAAGDYFAFCHSRRRVPARLRTMSATARFLGQKCIAD